MTTQRTLVRTPRKRKIWAGRHTSVTLSSANAPQMDDQLDPTLSDLGLSDMAGVTVMRAVGSVALITSISDATTPRYMNVRCGWIWLDQRLATASSGDTNIPRPLQDGTRDGRWYHQELLGGLEQTAPIVTGTPLGGWDTESMVRFDVTNMQKSPNASAKFMLVFQHQLTSQANTVALRIEVDYLLALP